MTKLDKAFLDAASKGHIGKLKKMLDAGANVNVPDSRGAPRNRTALMHAAEKGHLKAVDLLLNAGANIDDRDKGAPFDPGGNTALLLAIRGEHTDVAHRLLDAGASPKTKGGETSVITAAAHLGNLALFRRLASLGAHLTEVDGSGITPISAAVQARNIGIVEFLLSKGVSPDSLSPGRRPVLVDAAFGGRKGLKICKALVEAGADPDAGSEENFTPLMAACRSGRLEMVRYFLSLAVRINEIENKWKRTALDIVLGMEKPPDFAPDVLRRLKKLGQYMGPPLARMKEIERCLREAGAKTRAELRKRVTSRATGSRRTSPSSE